MSEFYRSTVHRARLSHRCSGCSNFIPAGSLYESSAGMFDGEFWSARLCPECIEHIASCEGCQDAMHDGWAHGDLGEWRAQCQNAETQA